MADNHHKKTFDYLLERFDNSDMTRLVWREGDFSVTMERTRPETTLVHHSAAPAQTAPSGTPAPAAAQNGGHIVTAPLVGTFYLASAPDAAPYVTVGQAVRPGEVLCIVEAMKTMNEIECDVAGTVTKILAQNAALVEYGAPLFEIAVER